MEGDTTGKKDFLPFLLMGAGGLLLYVLSKGKGEAAPSPIPTITPFAPTDTKVYSLEALWEVSDEKIPLEVANVYELEALWEVEEANVPPTLGAVYKLEALWEVSSEIGPAAPPQVVSYPSVYSLEALWEMSYSATKPPAPTPIDEVPPLPTYELPGEKAYAYGLEALWVVAHTAVPVAPVVTIAPTVTPPSQVLVPYAYGLEALWEVAYSVTPTAPVVVPVLPVVEPPRYELPGEKAYAYGLEALWVVAYPAPK